MTKRWPRGACGLLFFVVSISLASAAARAADADWPRFRGPNGQGISDAKTVPVRWTDKDYNWKVSLPGAGHSSPVLWGDRIFLTSADPKTAKRTVLCLAAADGRTLWRRDYPSKTYAQNEENNYASATPVADADAVYVIWTVPDEVSLLAPEEVIQAAASVEHVSAGWRALTVEAVFPLGTVGFLAVVSRALAEVSVPVMVFSSHDTDHFLVPSEHLGRALAALNQARLGRFLPRT